MEKTYPKVADAVASALTIPIRLRRCPFCNGTQFQGVQSVQEDGSLGNFSIDCLTCLASGPPAATLEEAGKRWNTRL